MDICGNCKLFVSSAFQGYCWEIGNVSAKWKACKGFVPKEHNGDFDDELDEYLFNNHQVKAGCCSSVESLKYQIAREVAERMVQKYCLNIQYVSQEERRKKMEEAYGINLLKQKEL